MEVRFRKGKAGRSCSWVAVRPPRTRVPGPTMAAGGDVPHDLYHFVIEEALGIEHGFWGCIAEGATFRTLGRPRTPHGMAVIDRHTAELDDAERRVNDVYFAWRRGEPTPADEALGGALIEWRELPENGELVRRWTRPVHVSRRPRRRDRTGPAGLGRDGSR